MSVCLSVFALVNLSRQLAETGKAEQKISHFRVWFFAYEVMCSVVYFLLYTVQNFWLLFSSSAREQQL